MQFGNWTVTSDSPVSGGRNPAWECRCSCGTTRRVFAHHLAYGKSRSCGCAKLVTVGDDGLKPCASCSQRLPVDSFYKNAKARSGLTSICKSCWSDRLIESKYELRPEDYRRMIDACDNRCEICGRHGLDSPHARLSVDHCHARGHVRGMLCTYCNTAIGLMNDNVETLERAAAYLRERQP